MMQRTDSKTVVGRSLSKTESRINKNTSLTTVQHRFGIQQTQVTVSPGALCTSCKKCAEGYLPHLWRKVCRTCFCSIEDHEGAVVGDIAAGASVPGRLGASKFDVKGSPSGTAPRVRKKLHTKFHELEKIARTESLSPKVSRDHIPSPLSTPPVESDLQKDCDLPPPPPELIDEPEYVWAPKDLDTQDKVDDFMQQLPDDIRPVADKQQEWNKKQMHQMPLHDSKILETAKPGKEVAEFIKNREKSYCEGTVQPVRKQICPYCEELIEDSNLAVQSDLVPGKSWHPGCFRCTTCKDFLVHLVHFIEGGKLYCGRHHAELTRPRCGGCDELIFEQEYTLAGGSKWHTHHFCCFYCDKPLGTEEEEYVTHEAQVVCLPCFDEILAGRCEVCKEKIGAGEHQLSCDDHHWHENCFKCSSCEIKLDAEDFLMHENKVFCGECYSSKFGEQCHKCKQVIKGKLITANKKHFHLECFVCTDCTESLTGRKFYKRDNLLYCATCYDKNFAVACAKCKEYVRTQGLRCKDKVYHRDCFLCTKCGTSLVSCSVVAKSSGVYCHACVE